MFYMFLYVFTELAKKGHRVSKNKLQFYKENVEYLAHTLKGNLRFILPEHMEAIKKAPKPNMIADTLSFL